MDVCSVSVRGQRGKTSFAPFAWVSNHYKEEGRKH